METKTFSLETFNPLRLKTDYEWGGKWFVVSVRNTLIVSSLLWGQNQTVFNEVRSFLTVSPFEPQPTACSWTIFQTLCTNQVCACTRQLTTVVGFKLYGLTFGISPKINCNMAVVKYILHMTAGVCTVCCSRRSNMAFTTWIASASWASSEKTKHLKFTFNLPCL